jgi:hypothetical protein
MVVRTATLNGTSYDLDLTGPLDGLMHDPRTSRPYITVCRSLDTKVGLESLIHECLHACFPTVGEDKITQTGNEMARLLWRLGYRRRNT